MNPLTITWAPHLYTEIGRQNVESLAHVGGIDNILFTPNGRLHRYLTSQAFKNLASFSTFYYWSKNDWAFNGNEIQYPTCYVWRTSSRVWKYIK